MSDIRERIAEENPELLFCDGYDDCIIGTVSRKLAETVVCYDLNAMIAKMVREGMTEEEAWEWYEYNIIDGYHGKYTPCFLRLALPDNEGCFTTFSEEPVKEKKVRKSKVRRGRRVDSDKQTQGWVDVITRPKKKR